jgi:hemerythrin
MPLNLSSLPQVALDFMNRDHAEFLVLRDSLLGRLSAQIPGEELSASLDELLEHTRHHFAAEERAMQETGFPPYLIHKSEHDRVLADMSAQIERWNHGRDSEALRQWIDQAVGDWLFNHVSTMDFVTAEFIAMKQKER